MKLAQLIAIASLGFCAAVPLAAQKPANDNYRQYQMQQQRQADQDRQRQQDQMRRQQQDQARQQLQQQQRQQMQDQMRAQQRQQLIDQQRRQLLDQQRQRQMDQLRNKQLQDARLAQQNGRPPARGTPSELTNKANDRILFSNGVAKLTRPLTAAEARRGFTGKVTADGRALVKFRGRVFAVPASRVGIKVPSPAARRANNAMVEARSTRWTPQQQARIQSNVQRLASADLAATARARIAAAADQKRPVDGRTPSNRDRGLMFVSSRTRRTTEPMKLYRYHGRNNITGEQETWLTNKKYANVEEARKGLAIRHDWGVIDRVSEVIVPAGTEIIEGKAAKQGEAYPGGDYQVAIENKNFKREWVQGEPKPFK